MTSFVGFMILGMIVLFLAFYLFGIIALFTTGISIIKKEGFSLSHSLSILFGLGVLGSNVILPIYIKQLDSIILISILSFIITVYSYFVFGFLIFLVSSLLYNLWYENRDKDYLIVLGGGLLGDEVTPLLASRIDKAIEFYHSQKDKNVSPPKIIMSGGQGPDEKIPEALAMKNYALEKGIPEENLLMEKQSVSTEENLKFSNHLIKQHSEIEDPKVLFFTTNYHVLRAGILAKSFGYNYNGIASKTKFYFYVSAILREYIGIIYFNRNKNLLFLSIIAVFYILNYIL